MATPRVPSRRYTDPIQAARERALVFGRVWLAACPSYELRAAGAFRVLDVADRSVLLVRGDDGLVRAFANRCRHRGTRLVDRPCGRARGTIDCPYHGWRFGLDGALRHVPGQGGFSELRLQTSGLTPVRHESAVGFEWICLDPDTGPLSEHLGPVAEMLAPYALDEMRPVASRRFDAACNWKAVLDNSLESYHVDTVHPSSMARWLDPARQDFTFYGDHITSIVDIALWPGRRWLDARTSRGGPYTERQQRSLHRFLIFPNLLINVLPCQLGLFRVLPDDAGSSRVEYAFCKRAGARGIEWLRVQATGLASRWLLAEDLPVLGRFQDGVASAPPTDHWLHREEAPIAHHHAALQRWLGQGQGPDPS